MKKCDHKNVFLLETTEAFTQTVIDDGKLSCNNEYGNIISTEFVCPKCKNRWNIDNNLPLFLKSLYERIRQLRGDC